MIIRKLLAMTSLLCLTVSMTAVHAAGEVDDRIVCGMMKKSEAIQNLMTVFPQQAFKYDEMTLANCEQGLVKETHKYFFSSQTAEGNCPNDFSHVQLNEELMSTDIVSKNFCIYTKK